MREGKREHRGRRERERERDQEGDIGDRKRTEHGERSRGTE